MDWVTYANQGATRNLPLSEDLLAALSFLPELGLGLEVFSGGQPPLGSGGPRVGSTRHDHGKSADVFFTRDGKRISWTSPDDIPVFQEVVRRGKAAGLTGFGAGEGYMQPGSMHIGFGPEAVWGAGGKGANAPDWLREAAGVPVGTASAQPTDGLLGAATLSTSGTDTMDKPGGLLGQFKRTEDNVGGLLGMLFKNMSPDRADSIRAALGSLPGIDNQGAVGAAQLRMQGRRDAESEDLRYARGLEERQRQEALAAQEQQAAMAAEEQQRAMAREWIAANAPDKLSAFDAGVITPAQVYEAANPDKNADVQTSSMLPDQSGTVMTMRDGSIRVVTVGGETLSGQAAIDYVQTAQDRAAEIQRSIYGAREEGKLTVQGELAPAIAGNTVREENIADAETIGAVERAKAEGAAAPETAKAFFDSAQLVGKDLSSIGSAIQAIDQGADSGFVYKRLPAFDVATATLKNEMSRMGLTVIGSVTFGALSEGEMDLAMQTAVPRDLSPPELREWLVAKQAAQAKVYTSLMEAAQHFASGGTQESYYAQIGAEPPIKGPVAPPTAGAAATGGGVIRYDQNGNRLP